MVFISAFAVWFAVWFGFAFAVGGAAERSAASLQLLAYLATLASNRLGFHHSYGAVRLDFWLIDTLLLAALYTLAMRATRFWPLWLVAIQLLAVIAHALRVINPTMLPSGYFAIVDLAAWPMIGITGLGALRHRGRLKRYGSDPSFMTFWRR